MLVVLDTNVLISSFLNSEGKPGQIIELVKENRFQIAYDDRILGEYEDILAWPKFGIKPAMAHILITHIELTGKWIDAEILSSVGFQDPYDLPFAGVFITAKAQALVTGNFRHFTPLINQELPVYSPAQFLDRFFSDQQSSILE
ncbi:MAG: putative toxin-antitoxin system toxin component, PIN family [Chloroflexi bacterium]|nr:putative toxin-antitoxin system toxin component, PIN family [Chloroflexota bacterium]